MRLILFSLITTLVKCFQPNCVPENQFNFFGFPVEACSEKFDKLCKFDEDGLLTSIGKAPLAKIKETPILPTCAFFNSPYLKHIYGASSKIKVLAPGSFINLPNLESIHLAFNFIREVRKDVFKDVSVEMLDLSWNEIVFIDHHAFDEVANLKYLNLSRNSLATVPLNMFSKSLIDLNLSYNFLSRIVLTSEQTPNISTADFSNNFIENVAISFKNNLEKVDLTSNRLKELDYIDILRVDTFRMGKNLFKEAPKYLVNTNARVIDLDPNPWRCSVLPKIWNRLTAYGIRVTASNSSESNGSALCSNVESSRVSTARRSSDCVSDYECADHMACRAGRCWDPCEGSLCPDGSICHSKNHVYTCSCQKGYLRDPLDIYSPCNEVECYTNDDCSMGKTCFGKNCIFLQVYYSLPPTRRTTTRLRTPPYTTTTTKYETSSVNLNMEKELPWWFDQIPSFEPPQKK